MKKLALFTALLFVFGTFMSCEKTQIEDEYSALKFEQLDNGTWNVNQVLNNQFNSQGVLTGSSSVIFGENTDRGVCTLHFENGKFTMDDNGTLTRMSYSVEDNIINLEDGSRFGVRELTQSTLELATPATINYNPCAYNIGGDVIFLSRPGTSTKSD